MKNKKQAPNRDWMAYKTPHSRTCILKKSATKARFKRTTLLYVPVEIRRRLS